MRFVRSATVCLVNCSAGVSRSASVCIAFLMAEHQMSFQEAFETVAKARPEICPNTGFRDQLLEYEELLKKQ